MYKSFFLVSILSITNRIAKHYLLFIIYIKYFYNMIFNKFLKRNFSFLRVFCELCGNVWATLPGKSETNVMILICISVAGIPNPNLCPQMPLPESVEIFKSIQLLKCNLVEGFNQFCRWICN